jgi:hypothetical protein
MNFGQISVIFFLLVAVAFLIVLCVIHKRHLNEIRAGVTVGTIYTYYGNGNQNPFTTTRTVFTITELKNGYVKYRVQTSPTRYSDFDFDYERSTSLSDFVKHIAQLKYVDIEHTDNE